MSMADDLGAHDEVAAADRDRARRGARASSRSARSARAPRQACRKRRRARARGIGTGTCTPGSWHGGSCTRGDTCADAGQRQAGRENE